MSHAPYRFRLSSSLLMAALLAVSLAAPAAAVARAGEPAVAPTPAVDIAFDRYMGVLQEDLKLTDQQQAKIRPIVKRYFDERRELRFKMTSGNAQERAAIRSQLLENRNRETRDLVKVLPPEQAKRLLELRKQATAGFTRWKKTPAPGGQS